MCGRTACTLAPDEICRSCSYSSHSGGRQEPQWRDPPGGQKYYPSHNVAPGAHTPVIISSHHRFGTEDDAVSTERVVQPMQWGLIPSWHKGSPKKVSYETNNCRSESMLEKPTYKVPLQRGRRCVVLADGFFEWKRDQAKKQPYFIYFPDKKDTDERETNSSCLKVKKEENGVSVKLERDSNLGIVKEEKENLEQEGGSECPADTSSLNPADVLLKKEIKTELNGTDKDHQAHKGGDKTKRLMTMAGVFDVWKSSDGSPPVLSYSVITVESSPAMMKVHHRMPALLLTDKEVQEWLDSENVPLEKAVNNIRATEEIQMHPVSDIVNNSRNKSPDCTKPIDLTKPKSTPSSNLMMKWLSKGKKEQSNEPPSKRIKTEPQ
ncbi:abasic site processing protein HMCES [Magallana gigas]|uniref:Abasic site processing protein HMCES n=2 Tax=Magallana gigas TaxID=29159 RepID=A0A8W8KL94_MAGGI|nr:abasic site processing protein HMCES [Crassostrea gigas]